MRKDVKADLEIYRNVGMMKEPLHLVSDLVEFFSDGYNEETAHSNSMETRKRLRAVREALLKDLNEVFRVLGAIDPDLVFDWKLGYCDLEEDDSE